MTVRISAIVLAAGLSSRMAPANKLLLDWQGESMIRHVVTTALQTPLYEVVVVTGHMGDEVAATLHGLPVRFVHNPDYRTGMGSSLACGTRHASPISEGLMVCLGDMPGISLGIFRALCALFDLHAGQAICMPTCDGKRGHPVLFPVGLRDRLATLSGDAGAKVIVDENEGSIAQVAVDDPAVLTDVDTPDAFVSKM